MKNLKIRAKLLITFMIVIFLFLITVIGAISGLQQNEERYSEFYHVGYRITNKIMSMRRGLQVIGKNLGYITIEHNSAEAEEYLADIQEEIALLNENATWLAENLEGNREQLLTFGDEAERALAVKNQVLEMAAVDVAKAQEMLLNEYQPLVEEAVKTLEQISNAAEADAENDYQNTVKLQSSLIVLQLSMAGVAFLCTILLCIYLTNSITKPAKELEVAAKKIVQGDFNIAVTYESRDELGSLAKTFKNMTVMLDGVISDASRLLKEMADGNFNVHTQKEEYYLGNFRGLLMSIRKLNRDLSSTLSQINHSADMVASGSGQVSNLSLIHI